MSETLRLRGRQVDYLGAQVPTALVGLQQPPPGDAQVAFGLPGDPAALRRHDVAGDAIGHVHRTGPGTRGRQG
ncbi:hypothetical protein ACFY64_18920 [Streptomyces collinus]|uniref:hypothetical protein n=1 Tax=Streptomyces collinus TaxID=42684 RepID=UPI0036BF3ED1